MSYIVGTSFPEEKLLIQALSNIFGLGSYQITNIRCKLGLGSDCKVKDLTAFQRHSLEEALDSLNVPLGPDLRRFQRDRVKRLGSILCYKGLRHRKGLPVRGQRTHTNAKRRTSIF